MKDEQLCCAFLAPCSVRRGLRPAARKLVSTLTSTNATLLLVEEWESREQFERNLDKAKLNAIVAAIELSSEAPVVRVDTVEREEGVDTLALHRDIISGAAR